MPAENKPCPLCGCELIEEVLIGINGYDEHVIECSECGCHIHGENLMHARSKWNRRGDIKDEKFTTDNQQRKAGYGRKAALRPKCRKKTRHFCLADPLCESLPILGICRPPRRKEKQMSIVSNDEICRVEYNTGGWMKLMRQTYTDKAPFYHVEESHLPYDLSVDSASDDLQYIIDYFERRIAGGKRMLDSLPEDETEVRKIYHHVSDITRQFLEKIKNAAAESCGKSAGHRTTAKAQNLQSQTSGV